jgi:hypothetical protein
VTCCKTTANGRKTCTVVSSPEKCKPPRGGTAGIGATESCSDACLPLLEEADVAQADIDGAAAAALNGLVNPWSTNYEQTFRRALAELQVRGQPDAARSRVHTSTATQQSAESTDCVPPGGATDCLREYCCGAAYCGAPSNSVTKPDGFYSPAGGCLNRACFEHDLQSFEGCIYGSQTPFGDTTGRPDCFFSPQSSTQDAPFFAACSLCPFKDGSHAKYDLLTCAIAQTLLVSRTFYLPNECKCDSCREYSSFLDRCVATDTLCNSATGACEPIPTPTPSPSPTPTPVACQTDLDCNPGATAQGADPDGDCVWKFCGGATSENPSGCYERPGYSYETDGSPCDDGKSCTTGEYCSTLLCCGTVCGGGQDTICPQKIDPDPDCTPMYCSGGGPDADADGCTSGHGPPWKGEPMGSPCVNQYGYPSTCQPDPFYGQVCAF